MPLLLFLSENPTLRLLQLCLLMLAAAAVYFVFFTTRDALLRSRSFAFQFLSIVLVACLPIVGFLLYLLIRPSQTLRDRDRDAMLQEIFDRLPGHSPGASKHSRHAAKGKKGQQTADALEEADATELDSLLKDSR